MRGGALKEESRLLTTAITIVVYLGDAERKTNASEKKAAKK